MDMMMNLRLARVTAAATMMLSVPTLAFAHTGHDQTAGFALGFLHPVSGLDHILAMAMVGLLAFRLGGRSMLMLPAAFVSLMLVGGMLGAAQTGLPFVETVIAASVVVLGVLIALDLALPATLAAVLVAFFALFHGYAHGVEIPENAGGLAFAAGFVAATATLHAAGLGLGFCLARLPVPALSVRSMGAAGALVGIALLAGAAA